MEQKLIHNVEMDLTEGFSRDKRQEMKQKHPIEELQENYLQKQEIQKLQSYSSNFGFHLPFKMMHERQMLSTSRRLPGERSSLLGLEIHMNRLESIDVEDYMGIDQPLTNQSIAHTVFIKQ